MQESNKRKENKEQKRETLRSILKLAFSAFCVVIALVVAFGIYAVHPLKNADNRLNHQELRKNEEDFSLYTAEQIHSGDEVLLSNDKKAAFFCSPIVYKTTGELQNIAALKETEAADNNPSYTPPMEEDDDESSDLIDLKIEELLNNSSIKFPEGEIRHDKDTFNILLLGTDLNVSKSTDGRGRADTIMICSLNYKTGDIKLVSILAREILVPITEKELIQLNRFYKYGGPELTISLIEHLFLVKIDGYAQMDFESFSDAIDLMGGVDIELTEKEALALNGKTVTNAWTENEVYEGWNHLNGKDALAYCRLRFIDDDWVRQGRQRATISACKSRLLELGPIEMAKVLTNVLPLINTNVSAGDVLQLLIHAVAFVKGSMYTLQVPDRNSTNGTVSCDFEYEAMKISNFLFDTEYELESPY